MNRLQWFNVVGFAAGLVIYLVEQITAFIA